MKGYVNKEKAFKEYYQEYDSLRKDGFFNVKEKRNRTVEKI